jgi:ABC-type sugar transport system permease subunit
MQVTVAPSLETPSAMRAKQGLRLNWWLALRLGAVLAVFALALFLRLRAVEFLDTDYDEDDYLRAGQLYAQHIAAGDIAGIANERENYEHPPLTKLIFGAILYTTHDDYAHPVTAFAGSVNGGPEIAIEAHNLRLFGAIVGALTATVVALINPLAGLLVAINSWHIKYTSQAMLEALPCLFAALMLLALRRSKRNGDWLWWAAAVLLGLTAASKYLYAVVGVAALIWMVWSNRQNQSDQKILKSVSVKGIKNLKIWKMAAVWVGVALIVFYLADPALWFNPIGNLWQSLMFSADYSTSQHVADSGFGWTQPAVWLFAAMPWPPANHPDAFPFLLDGLFSLFGLFALRRLWRIDRLLVLWMGVTMLFLFFWPTKWPQYILTMTVPVSLAAASWLQNRWQLSWNRWREWRKSRLTQTASTQSQWRAALPWLLPTLILGIVLIVYPLWVQTALSMSFFPTRELPNGVAGLMNNLWRGFWGLPGLTSKESYYGTGSVYFLFGQAEFMPILRFTIIWSAATLVFATILGLWLATLLQKHGVRARGAWYLLFILPWAIPEFVGALIWSTLFDDVNGAINLATGLKINWLSDTTPLIDFTALLKPISDTLFSWHLDPFAGTLQFLAETASTPKVFWVLVLVGTWVAFPFMLLVSTVALRSIPEEVNEAAAVDGAQKWKLWWHITWPLIRPSVWAGVLLRGALLFNAFQIPMMVGGGGRGYDTVTLSEYAYGGLRYTGVNGSYSWPALIDTVALGIALVLIWLYNKQTHVIEGVQYV